MRCLLLSAVLALPALTAVGAESAPRAGTEAVAGDAASTELRPTFDFTLPLRGGGNVRLAEYRGQRVVLALVAPWCVTCGEFLSELAASAEAAEVSVLAISATDRSGAVDAPNALTYPLLLDAERDVLSALDPPSLPYLVQIDEDGRIAGHGADLQAALQENEARAPSLWRRLLWRD